MNLCVPPPLPRHRLNNTPNDARQVSEIAGSPAVAIAQFG